jgi:hypothetical protein
MCVFWYNLYVNPKPLSPDLAKALHAAGDEPLPVIDPSSQNVYFVVDEQTHRKAMAALRQREDLEAIQAGIDDMKAGRSAPLAESFDRIEKQLKWPDVE